MFYKTINSLVVIFLVTAVFVNKPSALESAVTPLQAIFMIKQLIPQTQAIGIIWNQSRTNTNELMPKIERASASIGVKVIVEDAEQLNEVSQKFRDLKDNYSVQAIWVIENTEPMSSSVGRDYLIKNSIVNGIALFAPNTEWVSAGACAALLSDGSTVKLYVNKKTIAALGIKVPDKYLQDTQFVATN